MTAISSVNTTFQRKEKRVTDKRDTEQVDIIFNSSFLIKKKRKENEKRRRGCLQTKEKGAKSIVQC